MTQVGPLAPKFNVGDLASMTRILLIALLSFGAFACSGGECDQLSDCCRAFGGSAEECEVDGSASDDECKEGREAIVALAEICG